jgi:hypothetical protein
VNFSCYAPTRPHLFRETCISAGLNTILIKAYTTGRLQNEYCEYAASAIYIIHVFYMNDMHIAGSPRPWGPSMLCCCGDRPLPALNK